MATNLYIFAPRVIFWCHEESTVISAFPILLAESLYLLLSLTIYICNRCIFFYLNSFLREYPHEELELPQQLRLTADLHMDGAFRGSCPRWYDSLPKG